MPLEVTAPVWFYWALLLPSLALLVGLLRSLSREPPDPSRVRLALGHLISIFLVYLVVSSLVGYITDIPLFPRAWSLGLQVVLPAGFTSAAVVLLAWRAGDGGLSLGLKPPRRPRNALYVVLSCLAFHVPVGIATWAWIRLLIELGVTPIQQLPLEIYLRARQQGAFLEMTALSAGAVLVAPLAEELIFRGLIFGMLRARVGDWPAVLLTSAAFAAIHIQPAVLLPIFLVGLVLNTIYLRTGVLPYAMLFHALFNGGTLAYLSLGGA